MANVWRIVEWRYPPLAKKSHLFEVGDLRSLCRRWVYSGDAEREQDGYNKGTDCVLCWKAKARTAFMRLAGER
jgi:hypothetical protein